MFRLKGRAFIYDNAQGYNITISELQRYKLYNKNEMN